jgi:DNA-binding NarL/FixJ family response regulator
MAPKVTDWHIKRIAELKKIGLTNEVIAERLGISSRTVRVYTRAARTGLKPYSNHVSQ